MAPPQKGCPRLTFSQLPSILWDYALLTFTGLSSPWPARGQTPTSLRVPSSYGTRAHAALDHLLSVSVKSLFSYHITSSGVHATLQSLVLAEQPRWEVSQVPRKAT